MNLSFNIRHEIEKHIVTTSDYCDDIVDLHVVYDVPLNVLAFFCQLWKFADSLYHFMCSMEQRLFFKKVQYYALCYGNVCLAYCVYGEQ